MTTMTTDSPMKAPTTVDQQSPTTEPQTSGPSVQPGRPATSRRVLGWTATIATVGVAAVLAVTAFGSDRPDAPAFNDGGEATELDVRGIPTWWGDGPALNGGGGGAATELDVRGIPTWWQ